MLTLDELIRQQPRIHNDRTTTWGIHAALAEFLDRHVEPDTVSLETGAGLSTLVILRRRPRSHVAVQPVADEFAAILEFARQHEIDTSGFRGVLARSQEYLRNGTKRPPRPGRRWIGSARWRAPSAGS